MAEFNLSEVAIKAGQDVAQDLSKEAADATVRAVKRIANPPKKSLPAPTLATLPKKAPPAPPWFRYGLFALAGLAVFKLVSD
jgi:hypothetical protein